MAGPRLSIVPALLVAAVRDGKVSMTDALVCVELGTHSDRNGWMIVNQGTTAANTGLRRETVNRSVAKLVAADLLSKRSRTGKDGRQLANLYQVKLDREPPEFDGDDNEDLADPCDPPITPPVITAITPCNDSSSNEVHSVPECMDLPARSKPRACRLPSDFTPNIEWAVAEGMAPIDAGREADRFRDHWTAAPGQRGVKLDWDATWRNWVRNALDRLPSHRRSQGRQRQPDPLFAFCDDLLATSIVGDGHVIEHR